VLEHVAAHDRARPDLREPLEERRIGQVARDVDIRALDQLVMKQAHAPAGEWPIDALGGPRLCPAKLRMPRADAQKRREVAARKALELSGEPGSLCSQHGSSMGQR